MATRRRLDDLGFGSTEGGDYQPTAGPAQPPNATQPAAPQTPPAAPQPAGGFDRTQFRDAWMGSTGSLDDFIKQNPQFATGVQVSGNKRDIATLPSGEVMDLQIAKGANGDNALHGWTGVGETRPGGGGVNYYGQGGGSAPGGAPGGAGGGVGSSSSGPMFGNEVMDQLRKLFPGGAFNQDVVNRRTEGAADNLRRFQKSQGANDKAALAQRGLLGSGPEMTAQDRLQSNIADQYSNAVSGIYADESQAADSRMMQALQAAAGMSQSQSQDAINWFKAQNDRDLGFGNLGLSRELGLGNLDLNRSLGLGNLALGNQRLGLDASQLQYMMDHGDMQQLIDTIQQLYGGANTSAQGKVG